MTVNVQEISTGLLMQEFRELLLLGLDVLRDDVAKRRRADLLEAEILRRMAW